MPHQSGWRQKISEIGQTQVYWTFNKYPLEAIYVTSETAKRLLDIF